MIDGSDNFATRLAVSDACVALGIPLLSAAAVQFQGQVGLFRSKPCYRCFVGDAFDADDCDNCAELGVLGALTATVGSFAALLAINSIVGIGEDQAGKLHLFDGEKLELARRSESRPIPAAGPAAQPSASRNARDQVARDLFLARFGPVLDAVGGDQVNAVAVAAHHVARDVIGDDPVGALGDLLGDRLLDDALGLGGEADEQPRALRRSRRARRGCRGSART